MKTLTFILILIVINCYSVKSQNMNRTDGIWDVHYDFVDSEMESIEAGRTGWDVWELYSSAMINEYGLKITKTNCIPFDYVYNKFKSDKNTLYFDAVLKKGFKWVKSIMILKIVDSNNITGTVQLINSKTETANLKLVAKRKSK